MIEQYMYAEAFRIINELQYTEIEAMINLFIQKIEMYEYTELFAI